MAGMGLDLCWIQGWEYRDGFAIAEQDLYRGLSCFSYCRGGRKAEGVWEVGRRHSWGIVLSTQMGVRRRKGPIFGVKMFVCLGHHHTWWGSALLEMAEPLSALGTWWINSLLYFDCYCNTNVFIYLFLHSLQVFWLSPFWFHPRSPWWGNEWVAVRGLAAGHHNGGVYVYVLMNLCSWV